MAKLSPLAITLALLSSGCGLTHYSRRAIDMEIQRSCVAQYCTGYGGPDQPALHTCPHIQDLVPLCVGETQDKLRLETEENATWFQKLFISTVGAM